MWPLTVDASDATCPIVADPYIAAKWYGFQIRFTKNETRTMSLGAGGVASVAQYVWVPQVKAGMIASATVIGFWATAALTYDKCVAINYRLVWPKGMYPWYWSC